MMKLRETILKEHSKTNCLRIINWIGSNQQRFDELVHLFLHDEYRVIQRAGWPLSEIAVKQPKLVTKHLARILKHAQQPGNHEAVKRNTVRLLQEMDIPEKFHGEVMNLCFDWLVSPTEKPAVKAFSLTVLDNLSQQYPEIKQELKTIIEDRWDLETAAFRSRGKKILKKYKHQPAKS